MRVYNMASEKCDKCKCKAYYKISIDVSDGDDFDNLIDTVYLCEEHYKELRLWDRCKT